MQTRLPSRVTWWLVRTVDVRAVPTPEGVGRLDEPADRPPNGPSRGHRANSSEQHLRPSRRPITHRSRHSSVRPQPALNSIPITLSAIERSAALSPPGSHRSQACSQLCSDRCHSGTQSRAPSRRRRVAVAALHLHFPSEDRSIGGHVLEVAAEFRRPPRGGFDLHLPTDDLFLRTELPTPRTIASSRSRAVWRYRRGTVLIPNASEAGGAYLVRRDAESLEQARARRLTLGASWA